jgi:ubiquinone/menaquinone biosynthesis C-methylase UbiE
VPSRIITTKLNKIGIEDLVKKGKRYSLVARFLNIKSRFIFNKVKDSIKGNRILDVGTGVGGFAAYLSTKGYDVVSIDVDNSSLFEDFPTLLYNGNDFPFGDNEFDTVLLIHVLHHCENRMRVLREAIRVSQRVIFIEDTYRNKLEKLIVSFNDMLGNCEFYPHPYSTPNEWREIINRENCNILKEESYSRFTYHILYGRYVMFVVEKR